MSERPSFLLPGRPSASSKSLRTSGERFTPYSGRTSPTLTMGGPLYTPREIPPAGRTIPALPLKRRPLLQYATLGPETYFGPGFLPWNSADTYELLAATSGMREYVTPAQGIFFFNKDNLLLSPYQAILLYRQRKGALGPRTTRAITQEILEVD